MRTSIVKNRSFVLLSVRVRILTILEQFRSLHLFCAVSLYIINMEEGNVDPFLIEQVQLLAASDISKEDLTDSIAYFKGKYFYKDYIFIKIL